jgi:hypothetical protein
MPDETLTVGLDRGTPVPTAITRRTVRTMTVSVRDGPDGSARLMRVAPVRQMIDFSFFLFFPVSSRRT